MAYAVADRWGSPVFAGRQQAVDLFDEAVEQLVSLSGDPRPSPTRRRRAIQSWCSPACCRRISLCMRARHRESGGRGPSWATSIPGALKRASASCCMCSPSSRGRTANGSSGQLPRAGPAPRVPRSPGAQGRPGPLFLHRKPAGFARRRRTGFRGLAIGSARLRLRVWHVHVRARGERRIRSSRGSRPEGPSSRTPATCGLCMRRPTSSRWREPSVWGSRSWTTPSRTGPPATSPPTTGGTGRSTTLSFEKSTRLWPFTTALSVAPARASGSTWTTRHRCSGVCTSSGSTSAIVPEHCSRTSRGCWTTPSPCSTTGTR